MFFVVLFLLLTFPALKAKKELRYILVIQTVIIVVSMTQSSVGNRK